jgi:hypothetical protein
MSASTIRTIQNAIAVLYPNISLPHSLGTITALNREPDGEFVALPAVVVYRQPTDSIQRHSAGGYIVEREFVARLYVAKISNSNPLPSVDETLLDNVADCVEVVEDYFNITDNRLNKTAHVLESLIVGDTGDYRMQLVSTTKNTNLYAGIGFRHRVRYSRW